MAFHLKRSLGFGVIRFRVLPGERAIDAAEGELYSTGARGEYLGRPEAGLFFSEEAPAGEARYDTRLEVSRQSIFQTQSREFWIAVGINVLGALFILAGLGALMNEHAAGWVVIILGLLLIAGPWFFTAQRRRMIAQQVQAERAAREGEEKRRREILESVQEKLDFLKDNYSKEALVAVRREREFLTVPYDVFVPRARQAAVELGIRELAMTGGDAAAVNQRADEISAALGLNEEDARSVRAAIVRTLIWHLLADRRYGQRQEAAIDELKRVLRLTEPDLQQETKAISEFRRLRDIWAAGRSHCETPFKLKFQEICYYKAPAAMLERKHDQWQEVRSGELYVTSQKVVLHGGGKELEIPLEELRGIDGDFDDSVITLNVLDRGNPFHFRVEEPIIAGAMIDFADSST